MPHDTFDPAEWLTRWRDAGGGWTDRYLIRPRNRGDVATLASLTAQLDDDQREVVLAHLKRAAQ